MKNRVIEIKEYTFGANNVYQFPLLAFPVCTVPLVGMLAVVLGVSVLSFAALASQLAAECKGTPAGPAMGLPWVCSLLPHTWNGK